MAMHERISEREAEIEFNAAMAGVVENIRARAA